MRKLALVLVVASLLIGSVTVTAQRSEVQTVMVPMPDGTQLATEIYLPNGSGPFPGIRMFWPLRIFRLIMTGLLLSLLTAVQQIRFMPH